MAPTAQQGLTVDVVCMCKFGKEHVPPFSWFLRRFEKRALCGLSDRQVVGVVATSGKIHANVLRAVHNRQLEDWAR